VGSIKKELVGNQIVLVMIPSASYNDKIIKLMKSLSSGSVCYVTFNKTSDSLTEMFKKKKIKTDNILFIDAITKTIKKVPDKNANSYFCSSPAALTEISLAISKVLKHNFDVIIIDSLTNLLIYQKKNPVSKFVTSLINKIKTTDTKALLYALDVKDQENLIKETSTMIDKIVKY
jgi:KaiC/GvpD/RAD55 family RecA-like ATPase